MTTHLAVSVIAIDGTFASGKGTLGKALAAHYGLDYLDTGKLYRAVAHSVMQMGGDVENPSDGAKAAQSLDIDLLQDPVLKSGPVGAAASKVAIHTDVRQALFEFQRNFAKNSPKGGAVLDGRDIGTVICPDADVKLYVDASQEERAKRRYSELRGYGEDISLDTVLAQLKERDARDSGRALAPLKPAEDAHLIDTTGLSIEEVFQRATRIIDAVITSVPPRKS